MDEAVHLSRLTPLAFLERTAAVFPDRVGVVDGGRRTTWATFRDRAGRLAVALQEHDIRKDDMYTHRGAYLNALAEAAHAQLDRHSVYLWTLPMFHCNGWCFTWAVTAASGTHVCLRKVEPGRVWELIDSEGVTHYNGAPTVQ